MQRFRPHHFLCTLGFAGKGYSEEFVRGYQEIVDHLRDSELILVAGGTDSICGACPNRNGQVCASEAKIRALDQAHSEVLGLLPGRVLSWSEARKILAERMTLENFHAACASCSWKSLGVCQAALEKLHRENKTEFKAT